MQHKILKKKKNSERTPITKNSEPKKIGGNHPAQNNRLNKADMAKILPYSAKKNMANKIEEYSTL